MIISRCAKMSHLSVPALTKGLGYLTSSSNNLYLQKAESREFGIIKDKIVQDRLMFGRCGSTLSKHLHMEAELTLDKARWLIRQWKAVKE